MGRDILYKDAVEPLNDSKTISAMDSGLQCSQATKGSHIAMRNTLMLGAFTSDYVQTIGELSIIGVHSDSIDQLRSENEMLKEKLRIFEERISVLESRMPEEKVVIINDISYEDAVKEVRELFCKEQPLYYSDISQELGIDLKTVVKICNELQKSGEIAIAND